VNVNSVFHDCGDPSKINKYPHRKNTYLKLDRCFSYWATNRDSMQKQKEIFLLQIYITINSHISQLDFIEMMQEFYGTFSTGKKNHF
jgi:hypothetical protein